MCRNIIWLQKGNGLTHVTTVLKLKTSILHGWGSLEGCFILPLETLPKCPRHLMGAPSPISEQCCFIPHLTRLPLVLFHCTL